jgi:NAD(P)-dependent dehydrogenase (short-subunit alcohol dehydrogenase family)
MSSDHFGSLAGKTVLYTGAAGGLGLPTTLQLLRTGARVIAVDNDPQKIDQLTSAAGQENLTGLTLARLDLSELEELRRELGQMALDAGGIDVVINNAAIYPSRSFEDYSIADFQMVQRINVDAGIVCVQAALPWMKQRGWGRIINMSSITTTGGWENLGPYVQSKMALVALARTWAREFGKWGITANAIAPGAFPTDAEKIHPDLEGYTKRIFDHQAIQRRGRPEDIANAIMFLASDASSFITGQTINVDGGWIMH